jgi:hypothetical protein
MSEILENGDDSFAHCVKFPSQEAGDHVKRQCDDNKGDADI